MTSESFLQPGAPLKDSFRKCQSDPDDSSFPPCFPALLLSVFPLDHRRLG